MDGFVPSGTPSSWSTCRRQRLLPRRVFALSIGTQSAYRHSGCWQPQRSSVTCAASLQCSQQYFPSGLPFETRHLQAGCAHFLGSVIRVLQLLGVSPETTMSDPGAASLFPIAQISSHRLRGSAVRLESLLLRLPIVQSLAVSRAVHRQRRWMPARRVW